MTDSFCAGIHFIDSMKLGDQVKITLRSAACYIAPHNIRKARDGARQYRPLPCLPAERLSLPLPEGDKVMGGLFTNGTRHAPAYAGGLSGIEYHNQ